MVIIHILISLFLILISRKLFEKSFGVISIKEYMPHIHLWLLQLVIFCLVGSNLMVIGIRGYVISNFITNEESYLYGLYSVYYVMIILPISVIIFNYIFKFRIDKKLKVYLKKETNYYFIDSDFFIKILFVVMSIVSILTVVYLCYYDAPLFMLLTGRINRVLTARITYSRAFHGSAIIKNIVGETLIPLSSYIAFAYYRFTKQKPWKNIFFILLVSSLFIRGASLAKSGIAFYLIPYIYIITIMSRKIPYRKLVKIFLLVIPPLLMMYKVQYASSDLTIKDIVFDFYGGPLGRVFIVQIQSLPSYFEIFPKSFDFLMGKSIALFRHLGLPFIESARVVASFLEPVGVKEGWVGVANTLFVGDAYANFGLIGLIISPIWVAFVYSFFYWRLLSSPKTPLTIGYYVFILDNLTNSLTGGFFSAYVINTRVIVAMIFLFTIKLFVQIVGQKRNRFLNQVKSNKVIT
ncbi:MAG: hypothetical protein PWQ37_2946 [Candidatus Petromonas sp.]|nr:hypothetical protein [Candidatus Petromonas sp.]